MLGPLYRYTSTSLPVVVVKRRRRETPHPGHRSGAWKVAYADFVTAMMSLFLLLWILSVTSATQREAISTYFDPAAAALTKNGSNGVLGGKTIVEQGALASNQTVTGIHVPLPGAPETSRRHDDQNDPADKEQHAPADTAAKDGTPPDEQAAKREAVKPDATRQETVQQEAVDAAAKPGAAQRDAAKPDPAKLDAAKSDVAQPNATNADAASANAAKAEAARREAEHESQHFKEAEAALKQAIQAMPELQPLARNLIVDETPEGLRIQLVDQDGASMFPLGSIEMYDHTRKLLGLIEQSIAALPNKISVRGHTDAAPYRGGSAHYNNWDLSTDRANASRRTLEAAGLSPDRVAEVIGKADKDMLVPDKPMSPENRRISIILLREAPSPTPAAPQ